jgi:hypothetical protein
MAWMERKWSPRLIVSVGGSMLLRRVKDSAVREGAEKLALYFGFQQLDHLPHDHGNRR